MTTPVHPLDLSDAQALLRRCHTYTGELRLDGPVRRMLRAEGWTEVRLRRAVAALVDAGELEVETPGTVTVLRPVRRREREGAAS